MTGRFLAPFAAAMLATAMAPAQEPPPADPPAVPSPAEPAADPLRPVRDTIEALAAAPGVRTGSTGFYLARLDAPDKPVFAREAGRSFITASTMKTITTGCALEILGPDFRFGTRLEYAPETGDLIVRGAGDPTFGRPDWEGDFDAWTEALRRAGIRNIDGRVIADESAWEDEPLPGGWSWVDIGNYYAPALTPLCFHDNSFRIRFRLRGKPGEPAEFFDADPWPPGLRILDEVRVGAPGTGDNAYAFGAPGATQYIVRGTFAADAGKDDLRAALPDPALFCAQQFTRWLNEREIPVRGEPTTTRRMVRAAGLHSPDGRLPVAAAEPGSARTTVATRYSGPLRDLLVPINHRSLNLDCECLVRTIGEGQLRRGLQRIRRHLRAKGLPLDGYSQADGSGLARLNHITPELLARANAAFLTGRHGADFRNSLAVAGTPDSTLRRIAPGGRAAIRAKSGTIEQVKSYTGVVEAAGGAWIFAVLVNDYEGRYDAAVGPAIDRLFRELARFAEAAGSDRSDRSD